MLDLSESAPDLEIGAKMRKKTLLIAFKHVKLRTFGRDKTNVVVLIKWCYVKSLMIIVIHHFLAI